MNNHNFYDNILNEMRAGNRYSDDKHAYQSYQMPLMYVAHDNFNPKKYSKSHHPLVNLTNYINQNGIMVGVIAVLVSIMYLKK
jgi:hypothetical protein